MKSSNNINIASRSVLSSPGAIRSELPLSLDAVMKVMDSRGRRSAISWTENRSVS